MDLQKKKELLIAEIKKKKIPTETKEEAIKAIESFTKDTLNGGPRLCDAFVWDNTLQGHDFWSEINGTIREC